MTEEPESTAPTPETRPECRGILPQCINCRREVEDSMARAVRGRMRTLRKSDLCRPSECVRFLKKVKDDDVRHHLACMAWWRMSTFTDSDEVRGIVEVMQGNRAPVREFGPEYMHRAITALSPLKPEQLSVWFGFENLYQAVSLYMGEKSEERGVHCQNCLLFKQGCTDYGRKGVENCRLWQDKFIQAVAGVVAADKKWDNPCSKIPKELKAKEVHK